MTARSDQSESARVLDLAHIALGWADQLVEFAREHSYDDVAARRFVRAVNDDAMRQLDDDARR